MDTDYSALDVLIQRYIRAKTPAQIAEMAGCTPEEVISRAREMRDEIDRITLDESATFLMMSLNRIAANAERDAEAAGFDQKGTLYTAAVGAIKESLKQITIIQAENKDAIIELNRKRMVELLRLMDVVVDKGVEEIAATHGLEASELRQVFNSKIELAAMELESK